MLANTQLGRIKDPMDLREIIQIGPSENVLVVIPSAEGGLFTQERGLDKTRDVGEIALIYGLLPAEIEMIEGGDASFLNELIREDPSDPGTHTFSGGIHANLLSGSKAHESLTPNAASVGRFGLAHLKEFSPNWRRLGLSIEKSVITTSTE